MVGSSEGEEIASRAGRCVLRALRPNIVVRERLGSKSVILFGHRPSLREVDVVTRRMEMLPCGAFELGLYMYPPCGTSFSKSRVGVRIFRASRSHTRTGSLVHMRRRVLSPEFKKPVVNTVRSRVDNTCLLAHSNIRFARRRTLRVVEGSRLGVPRFGSGR